MHRVLRAGVVACLLSVACGGGSSSSVTPTPVPTPTPSPVPAPVPPPAPASPPVVADVGGRWGGTMEFAYNGRELQRIATTVLLQQADRAVTGTWRATQEDVTGEIRGTLSGVGADTTFSGVITWSSDTATGTGRCVGSASFSGPAEPPVFTWVSPAWDWGQTCQNGSRDVKWNLVRF